MKKLLLILLCLPLIFSSCQEDDPVPAASPAPPPACCTFYGTVNTTTLTYNPTQSSGGQAIQIMCGPATVAKNLNGDIVDIELQFWSFCGTDFDWNMLVKLNSTLTDSIIQNNQLYNLGTPADNHVLGTFMFYDYNCGFSPISTHLMTPDPPNQSGTVEFNVDWVNNEIGGTFTLTGEDGLGILPPKTVSCTFSGLPFLMK